MEAYLPGCTKGLRNGPKLFMSFVRSRRNPVGVRSIGRWIKTVFALSGIDTLIFSAHSTNEQGQ